MLRDPGSSAGSNLPYLGIACGFFAKLAAKKPVHFTAAASLLRVAQKLVEKASSSGGL